MSICQRNHPGKPCSDGLRETIVAKPEERKKLILAYLRHYHKILLACEAYNPKLDNLIECLEREQK